MNRSYSIAKTVPTASMVLLLSVLLTDGCHMIEKPSAISKGESMSPSLQKLEPIRNKYEGKIIPGITDKDYPRYAAAMEKLLGEWNPVGHTAEEVEFVIGVPSEISKDDLMYRFEDGFSGVAWLFKLKDGNVIEVQQLSID